MRVHVGSENVAKLAAAREALALWGELGASEVVGVPVESGVSGHPTSIAETVQGAVNRARAAFPGAQLSLGLEGGLVAVPGTKTGFLEVTVAAVHDGKETFVGMSAGFEFPATVAALIREGVEASDAVRRVGLSQHAKLGNTEGGVIGLLSKGRFSRREQARQAVVSALMNRDTARA